MQRRKNIIRVKMRENYKYDASKKKKMNAGGGVQTVNGGCRKK